jgi:hypothetical protein
LVCGRGDKELFYKGLDKDHYMCDTCLSEECLFVFLEKDADQKVPSLFTEKENPTRIILTRNRNCGKRKPSGQFLPFSGTYICARISPLQPSPGIVVLVADRNIAFP